MRPTVQITLRDAATGESRVRDDNFWPDDATPENVEFFWTMGNGACDYARAQKFYGDDDPSPPLAPEVPMGGGFTHVCEQGPNGTHRFTIVTLLFNGEELGTEPW